MPLSWLTIITLWFGSPNPRWKRKNKSHFCVCSIFKGIGLLPLALFFPPWIRVYNSSWLLNRWSTWKSKIHSRASCLNHAARLSACTSQPHLTGSTFHVSWKHFLEEKEKMPNNNIGKIKEQHLNTPTLHPSKTVIILFSPWNNYEETPQANTEY